MGEYLVTTLSRQEKYQEGLDEYLYVLSSMDLRNYKIPLEMKQVLDGLKSLYKININTKNKTKIIESLDERLSVEDIRNKMFNLTECYDGVR